MCYLLAELGADDGVMMVMLFLVGPRHPRVLDDYEPLDRGRYWLAVFALVMLVLCFTPAPIRITLP